MSETPEMQDVTKAMRQLGNIVADIVDTALEEAITNMVRTIRPDMEVSKRFVGSVIGMAAMEVARRRADEAKREMLEDMDLDRLEEKLAELTGVDKDAVHDALESTNEHVG